MFERLLNLGFSRGAIFAIFAIFATGAMLLSCGGADTKTDTPPLAEAAKVAKVSDAIPAGPSVKVRVNRLYAGAPPVIPHEIDDTDGDGECMDCHEDGGEAGDEKVAPMVAHPQLVNCRQCHTPQIGKKDFVAMEFTARRPGWKVRRPYPDAPPAIPHYVGELRGKCVACHAGPAPRGTVTTHPERSVCRQCHVASTPD